jgi:hypothetical protein
MDENNDAGPGERYVDYVNHADWTVRVGREDLIDEIADEFERPGPTGRELFWSRRVGWAASA